jgi:hypothetical protein
MVASIPSQQSALNLTIDGHMAQYLPIHCELANKQRMCVGCLQNSRAFECVKDGLHLVHKAFKSRAHPCQNGLNSSFPFAFWLPTSEGSAATVQQSRWPLAIQVFWAMAPCSDTAGYQRFGETSWLHLHPQPWRLPTWKPRISLEC